MDGMVREMKAELKKRGAETECGGEEWWLITNLFVDDTVLFAESEEEMKKAVSVFYVCKHR